MSIMTVEAGGNVEIPFGQAQTMDAFAVLAVLIGREIVLAHLLHISVTGSAQGRDILPGWCADVARLRRHGPIHARGAGIAAMTVGTGDATGGVDTAFPSTGDLLVSAT